jgi:hypothetical protein
MIKILNKYRFIKGAKSKPPTPRLVPPPSGQNFLKSMSVADSVDILCEGPIYGLVDQFGKKVYGLDMLKGIYLNKVPVMNSQGEYNYRNVLMEINLGTENQKPLVNFNHVYIQKNVNFKLLGAIDPNERDERPDNKDSFSNNSVGKVDFTSWAKSANGWPNVPQDPFVFVHHVRNKDVKRIKIGLIVEQLYDTISEGKGRGEAGSMGMNKQSSVELLIKWGIEGSKIYSSRRIIIQGMVLSPYAYMIGEPGIALSFDSASANTGVRTGSQTGFGTSTGAGTPIGGGGGVQPAGGGVNRAPGEYLPPRTEDPFVWQAFARPK